MSLLEDYIKDLNMLETARRSTKFTRILSIDFVKGFAICLIVLAHSADVWVDPEWRFAYGMVFSWMDVFGPSLFIFLSALSVIFSLKKKSGFVPEKVIRNNIFTRGIIIIILGIFFNLPANINAGVPFPLNLWGWNILMFIGFSQIICFYATKLSRGSRVGVGISIIFLTDYIRDYLYVGKDTNPVINILHFFVVSPIPQLPFIPYVSLCFFSTIFGEMFFEAMLLETEDAYMDTFRSFMKYGLIFVLMGISIPIINGPYLVTAKDLKPEEYPFIELLALMQNQPYTEIPGMLKFLVRGTISNMFYSLGMALLILGVSFYYIDIKHIENHFTKMLIFYGRISLSIFFISYIWLAIYIRHLNIIFFFFMYFGYVGFLGIFLYTWNKWAGGVGTFEWVMTQMTGSGKKKK